jgi:phosphinothricin acetyltransferase
MDREIIVPMTCEHGPEVLAIYRAGIEEGNATFETQAPTWEHFDQAKLSEHRFVAVDQDGRVLGWVAVSLRPLRLRGRGRALGLCRP